MRALRERPHRLAFHRHGTDMLPLSLRHGQRLRDLGGRWPVTVHVTLGCLRVEGPKGAVELFPGHTAHLSPGESCELAAFGQTDLMLADTVRGLPPEGNSPTIFGNPPGAGAAGTC